MYTVIIYHSHAFVFSRARSSSSDRRTPGVSPGGRKQVVFAGIEDNSSSSSSGDEDKPSGSGDSAAEEPEDREVDEEEEVWVKRPEVSRPKEADVPVTGVVVAKPSLCQNYPGAAN